MTLTRKRRDTGPSKAVRRLVAERAGFRCERCRCLPWPAGQVHHRKPRGLGGTSDPTVNLPEWLAFLCSDCHLHIESHRRESYEQGWLVRRGS